MPTRCDNSFPFHWVGVIFWSCLLIHLGVCPFIFIIFQFHCVDSHHAVVSRYFLMLILYRFCFNFRNSILEIIFVMCLNSAIIGVHSIELVWSSGIVCSFTSEFVLSFLSYSNRAVLLAIMLASVLLYNDFIQHLFLEFFFTIPNNSDVGYIRTLPCF